jgi:peroxiredoxin Q/BCP
MANSIPSTGQAAPAFSLPSSTGQTISLDDFKGKKMVVLYFYPKADTPGCTTESCGFRDALPDYNRADIAVLGISPDPVADVEKFAKKFNLNFPLLADADHSIALKYGVWMEKNRDGKMFWGVGRTTFVIDRECRVVHVFEKVNPEGHEKEVIAWIAGNLQ